MKDKTHIENKHVDVLIQFSIKKIQMKSTMENY